MLRLFVKFIYRPYNKMKWWLHDFDIKCCDENNRQQGR
jgi:hypothetical protein